MSQPVRVKLAGAGDLSKPTTLFKSKFRGILRFGMLVLKYLINNVLNLSQSSLKDWSVILQGTLVGHIESIILNWSYNI